MTLSFSLKHNGINLYFPEKILRSIFLNYNMSLHSFSSCQDELIMHGKYEWGGIKGDKRKHHTIRVDKNDRWKAGRKIHFTICNRSKFRLQFAPIIEVVSTQSIVIKYTSVDDCRVGKITIDGRDYLHFIVDEDNKFISSKQENFDLMYNDGFDTIQQFIDYFSEDFTGKIIHWTDLKY